MKVRCAWERSLWFPWHAAISPAICEPSGTDLSLLTDPPLWCLVFASPRASSHQDKSPKLSTTTRWRVTLKATIDASNPPSENGTGPTAYKMVNFLVPAGQKVPGTCVVLPGEGEDPLCTERLGEGLDHHQGFKAKPQRATSPWRNRWFGGSLYPRSCGGCMPLHRS